MNAAVISLFVLSGLLQAPSQQEGGLQDIRAYLKISERLSTASLDLVIN